MNKNNKFIFIFLFIHTHIFVFYFFIFLGWARPSQLIFLGWAQLIPHGLAQASDPAGQKKTKSTREVNSSVHEHCSCNNSI
jgi:hypothetical protein